MIEKSLGPIPANPVKSFFVHVLTRDIELQDAILDLLDNCVDGIQRVETKRTLSKREPYQGYWAKIDFSNQEFCIEDNCGGIPWGLHEYAFRMGRLREVSDQGRRSIGTYGIGMKRAIFKIGKDCTITTHAKDCSYRLRLSPEWMEGQEEWEIPAVEIAPARTLGTRVRIKQLHLSVQKDFGSESWENTFRDAIATRYAYILGKGFQVNVKERAIKPKSIHLLFSKGGIDSKKEHPIRPFIYEARQNGVDVFLAVGFTRPIPSRDEADQSQENYKERYSSADAGWTVICNDRTIVYCDKTSLTGWGISGVPQYHFQFIAISGIVVFSSEDASLLPMTTTKRGIEASSDLYLQIRDKMIEGMKIFTQYTNLWKSRDLAAESRRHFRKIPMASVPEILQNASRLTMVPTRGTVKGRQYKPTLPRPEKQKTHERITFLRPVKEVRRVSAYLFDSPDKQPSEVGEKCFDMILKEAPK
jgi:hypothetical protein